MHGVAVDLCEAAVNLAGVKIGGVHVVGPQLTRVYKPEVQHALSCGGEVIYETPGMVKTFFARGEHVTVNRRRIVVLLDELDLVVAEVTECVRDISFLVGAAILELVGLVMWHQYKRTGTVQAMPLTGRLFDIVNKIGVLKNWVQAHSDIPSIDACLRVSLNLHWTSKRDGHCVMRLTTTIAP